MNTADLIILTVMMALLGTSAGAILSNEPSAFLPLMLLVAIVAIVYGMFYLPKKWNKKDQ